MDVIPEGTGVLPVAAHGLFGPGVRETATAASQSRVATHGLTEGAVTGCTLRLVEHFAVFNGTLSRRQALTVRADIDIPACDLLCTGRAAVTKVAGFFGESKTRRQQSAREKCQILMQVGH